MNTSSVRARCMNRRMEYATGQQKVAGHDASHTPGKLMVPVLFTSMVECLPDGGTALYE